MLPGAALPEALAVAGLLTLGGVVILPRAVVCVGAGAVLGWSGVVPSLIGSGLGATLGFLLARHLFAGLIGGFVARRPKVAAVLRALEAEGWRVLGPLRLASPVPGPAINFACGLSRMGYRAYIVTTLVGVVPQTLLFVHLGRTGRRALAGPSLLSPDGLVAAAGLVLTGLALWRLAVAARRHSARLLAEAEEPAGP